MLTFLAAKTTHLAITGAPGARHWVRMQELRHARPQLSLQLVALSPLLVLQPAGNEEEENDADLRELRR